jgi:DNA-binding YbaB/EbfC family protein
MFDPSMLGKLQEMQQKMEDTKSRLQTITVKGFSPGNKVQVIASADKKIQSVQIDPSLLQQDPEELEDHLIIAVNQAIQAAENVWESEMRVVAMGFMPGT